MSTQDDLKLIGQSADRTKLFSVWYRSTTPDGKSWCESSNPEEVRRMSEGFDCTFTVMKTYLVTLDWQPWNPDDA